MDVIVFNSYELPIGLGALRALEPELSTRQIAFLETLARLHGSDLRAHELRRIPAWRAAASIESPHRRKRLVQLAIVMSTVDGQVSRAMANAVAQLAYALDIDEPGVRTLQKLVKKRTLAIRFDMVPRMFRKILAPAWQAEGFKGIYKIAAALLGRGTDPQVAQRYAKLGGFPPGSVGRAFYDHCATNGFALPGTRGAIPERLLFHDIGHVLAGYSTKPEDEIQQAAFQAGFVREDGFVFLFFGIMQFHLGIRLTPVAKSEVGYFDVEKVLNALARGAACRADLSDGWDFWAHAAAPVVHVRAELAIPPRVSSERAA